MRNLVASVVVASVVFLGFAQVSQAHGFNRRCSRGGCDSAPCGEVVQAVPVQPTFEERKVVRFKPVMVEKEIEVLECKRVARNEKFTYTVCVPVTTQEKRKVIVCNEVWKDVEFTYTVCVPVTTQEKRKEVVITPVKKEVDFTYTVMVPVTTQKKVKVTTYDCVRENVTECVPVCRLVRVNYVDECGRCCSRLERVTVMETRTRCVVKRIPVEREVIVNEVNCVKEERKGKKIVCEYVKSERDVVVNVCRTEMQQKKGIRKVCEIVRSEKEVVVNVCNYVHEKREGTRTVYDNVTTKVKRKVQVCEMVRYEETIRVQVGGACATPCDAPRQGGFFRRCCN